MSEHLIHAKKLSKLDYAFSLMDSTDSPQDFTIILHLSKHPSLDNLRAGAASATNRYPLSGCTIKNRSWVFTANRSPQLPLNGNSPPSLESFVNERFDTRREAPVKQLLLTRGESGASLVTRFHHAAADGLSAALCVGHQLGVAYKLIEPETS